LSMDRYSKLTQSLWGKYNIIIWPESSLPLPLQMAESFIDNLDRQGKESGSTLILGIPIEGNGGYYNTIVTVGQGKNQVYQKRHLVPFGEYIPFSRFLSNALNFMNIPQAQSLSGKNEQPHFVIDDIKILPSICYEITFPSLIRYGNKSINMLLVVTNDAWFGHSNAQPQHLQMAAMRALEFGKPVLFVSNDGITAIINPDGRVETTIPQRQAKILVGSVQPMSGATPWVNHGGIPIVLILFYLLFMATRANKIADKQVAIETINTQ
jgi:apolipoprotein N-acyltransferase